MISETNAFKAKYYFCLWKAYFEKGYGLTALVKYFVLLYGLNEAMATQDITRTLVLGVIYIIFCFLIGFLWYKFNIIRAEAEVNNQFNYFQQQVRAKFGIPKTLNSRMTNKRYGK